LKIKYFAVLCSVIAMSMMLPACSQNANNTNTPTPTQTAATPTQTASTVTTTPSQPQIIEKDKSYNVISPRGVALPVDVKPLAARPSSLDGLVVYVNQAEADPVVMPAIWARVQKDYPKVQWKLILPTSLFGPNAPEADVLKDAKAVIRGVGW
jgi:hypothetical protein